MVTLTVLDAKGHTTRQVSATDALQEIREQSERGYWIYIDGNFVRASEVTLADVERANEVTLSPSLVGGLK